ncbi:glycosyltransferase family 39 protein [Planctomycetes bacterium Pan216]|uniref:ArnT family glycosyltransferase n=1 Tax=Kolteria novifilia TaxID=2527975 RepID=UPI0011A48D45
MLAVLAGFALRVYGIWEVGLSHFDEGIYAISGLWPWTDRFEANQGFYSPPIHPINVGLAMLALGGPSDTAVLLPSLLFGTLLIPLVWWIGRSWWEPRIGVLAAWLVAVDGLQVSFSRTGLTDPTFTFAALLALYLCRWALDANPAKGLGPTLFRVLIAGSAIGVAWNVKYNGLLPVVLSFGFIPGEHWKRRAVSLALIALFATATYLPWAAMFHVEHGYGSLMEHQRGYVQGLAAIPRNLLAASHGIRSLALAWPPLVIVVAGVGLPLISGSWRSTLPWGVLVGGLAALALAWVPTVTLVVLACVGIWGMATRLDRIAFCWIQVLILIIPSLYTPYLRLWLPTDALHMLLAAVGFVHIVDTLPTRFAAPRNRLAASLATGIGGVASLLALVVALSTSFLPERAVGYRSAARSMASALKDSNRAPVGLVRPPLVFYLALDGMSVGRLAGESLGAISGNQWLLVDRAVEDSPDFERELQARVGVSLREVETFPVEPSHITRLDDVPFAGSSEESIDYDVHVYEPAAGGR